ncbi:hypothetical protein BHE74_00013211 [Ensete ventricosum]|nr:hypothetical protein BHE74_00013211 [Ensete ventricosum]
MAVGWGNDNCGGQLGERKVTVNNFGHAKDWFRLRLGHIEGRNEERDAASRPITVALSCCLPSGVLRYGQPIAFTLPCHQPPVIRGTADRLGFRVSQLVGLTPDVRPTRRHCDMAKVGCRVGIKGSERVRDKEREGERGVRGFEHGVQGAVGFETRLLPEDLYLLQWLLHCAGCEKDEQKGLRQLAYGGSAIVTVVFNVGVRRSRSIKLV